MKKHSVVQSKWSNLGRGGRSSQIPSSGFPEDLVQYFIKSISGRGDIPGEGSGANDVWNVKASAAGLWKQDVAALKAGKADDP